MANSLASASPDRAGLTLGIDPGTALMGFGLVYQERGVLRCVEYGCLSTQAGTPAADRLVILFEGVEKLITTHHPTNLAIEELFFNSNARTAISVAQARGVVLLCAARAGLAIAEYTPLEVKQAVVGYGRATKDQIQQMVTHLLRLPAPPKPDDAADALAVAICHTHSARLTALTAGRP